MKKCILSLLLAGSISSAYGMVTVPSTTVVLPTINEFIPKSFYIRAVGLSTCLSGIYVLTSQLSHQKSTLEKEDVTRYLGGSALITAGALTLFLAK